MVVEANAGKPSNFPNVVFRIGEVRGTPAESVAGLLDDSSFFEYITSVWPLKAKQNARASGSTSSPTSLAAISARRHTWRSLRPRARFVVTSGAGSESPTRGLNVAGRRWERKIVTVLFAELPDFAQSEGIPAFCPVERPDLTAYDSNPGLKGDGDG